MDCCMCLIVGNLAAGHADGRVRSEERFRRNAKNLVEKNDTSAKTFKRE
jgi:hypothetical protein